jgi:hypothetical protein
MSAELLRQAATILRERAEAATRPEAMHPWGDKSIPALPPEAHPAEVEGYLGGTWGTYYATMHPGVGLALAKWLDDIAAGWIWDENPEDIVTTDGWPLTLDESMDKHALTLARLIVGDA